MIASSETSGPPGFLSPPSRGKAGDSSPALAGFLLATTGRPELQRGGQSIEPRAAMPVMTGDRVKLLRGVSVSLVVPSGPTNLSGPHEFTVTRMQADRTMTPEIDLWTTVLLEPTATVLARMPLQLQRSASRFPIYSPQGYTRRVPVTIIWKTESGKTYDLLISSAINPDEPAISLRRVTSPVHLPDPAASTARRTSSSAPRTAGNAGLTADTLYRVRIFPSGKQVPMAETHFQTSRQPVETGDRPLSAEQKLELASGALAEQPPRLGDALAELLTLSDEYAASELALRLKLYAFGQLGLKDEYESARDELRNRYASAAP